MSYESAIKEFMLGTDLNVSALAKKHDVPRGMLYYKLSTEIMTRMNIRSKDIVDLASEQQRSLAAARQKEYRHRLKMLLLSVKANNSNNEEKLQEAVEFWWSFRGGVPIGYIAQEFDCDLNKITLEIQRQISSKSGVEICDTAPSVEVTYTQEELEEMHPNQKYSSDMPFDLSFFYYLANPQNNQRHEESLYRGTDF